MESNGMLNAFGVTQEVYDRSVVSAIEIITPHVTNSYIYVDRIIVTMKSYTNSMSNEEQILIAYGVGGIISSIMEKCDQGFLATDVLESIVRESRRK